MLYKLSAFSFVALASVAMNAVVTAVPYRYLMREARKNGGDDFARGVAPKEGDPSGRGARHLRRSDRKLEASACTTTSVLVRGEDLYSEMYSLHTYNVSAWPYEPVAGDNDFYNLPLLDPEEYLHNNGTIRLLGYVQEELQYLPHAGFNNLTDEEYEPECHGTETWTFVNDDGEVTGQVTDQYSCRGFTRTVITGGTLDYHCAQGQAVKVNVTDDCKYIMHNGAFLYSHSLCLDI